MGIPIFVMGESGSGKTASLRNFNRGEVLVFNVANKPLPFKKNINVINFKKNENKYEKIKSMITQTLKSEKSSNIKTFVIDDSQYLLAFEVVDKVFEKGYDKWQVLASNFVNLLLFITNELPKDTKVYLLHHTEVKSNDKLMLKTVGKMLDNLITLEGLATIVIMSIIDEMEQFKFLVKNPGHTSVKTPIGMFETPTVDNDLKMVDQVINDYYKE